MTLLDLGLVLLAYLFGSISTAILVARAMGLPDPRTQGSGNPGATNVLRIGGKKAGAITLLGDALKGLLPVLVAAYAVGVTDQVLAMVAFAAFMGHLFPVFFDFKGGKGVATALGVLLGLSWPVGLAVVGTWLLMAKLFKISSLSALTASALAPLYMWLVEPEKPEFLIMVIAMSIILIARHRSNIEKLLRGEEKKIGQKG